jgi:hypothetical integral membrane protein (TIGR02206 family)
MNSSFELFGMAHVLALAGTGVLATLAAAASRRHAALDRGLRVGLALVLGGMAAFAITHLATSGMLRWYHLVPLQVSDFSVLVAITALVTRWRPACEVLYFWGLTGVLLAKVMPAVQGPMSDPITAGYFALHGLVVVAAVLLTFGSKVVPSKGAHWRVFAFTAGYTGMVGVVNALTGANFLFLRRPPPEPTLLDYFGPWPIYLVAVAAIAAASFALLARLAPATDHQR